MMEQERAKMEKIWSQEMDGHGQNSASPSPLDVVMDHSNPPSPRIEAHDSPSPPSGNTLQTQRNDDVDGSQEVEDIR